MQTPKKTTLTRSYNKTMADMRRELPRHQAILSRVVHAPGVSHLLALFTATLMRPLPFLVGCAAAIIFLIGSYLIARLHGYVPSGAEPFVGFSAGWLCGLIYEGYDSIARRMR